MAYLKSALFLTLVLSTSFVHALTLTSAGQAALDSSDETWFAHAGIKQAGFAGESGYTYNMDHDTFDGITLKITNNKGTQVFETQIETSIPKEIKAFPKQDYLFIFHEEPGNYGDKNLDVYKLSTGDLIKSIFKSDLKTFFFSAEESKLYYTSFGTIYTENLKDNTQGTQSYDSNTLRAFVTTKGLFFIERIVGKPTGRVLDKNQAELYTFNDPHKIFLTPNKFNIEVAHDQYLIIYKKAGLRLLSLYDLKNKTELLNNESEDISFSKPSTESKSIAFYHVNSKLTSLLDFSTGKLIKKDVRYTNLFQATTDTDTGHIRFLDFPEGKIIDLNFDSLQKGSVDFQCTDFTFTENGKFVGCKKQSSFEWWSLN